MFPKVNDFVYLQVASADKDEANKECKSRIADLDEESFLIEVPIETVSGRIKRLHGGEELSVYFLTEGGIKNYFNTYVLGFASDVVQLIRIHKPALESITKIQRRDFLRVIAELEIAVKLKDNTRFVTYTDDVGGGGVSFLSEDNYNLTSGDVLECWLLVPYKNGSVEHVPFEAEVVRTKNLESGRWVTMLKFLNISNLERQKLIRFSFERQFDFKNR